MINMQLTLCIVTKNKATHTTTLHSAMTMNMICMTRGINLSIHFVKDQSGLQKLLKGCDRLVWIDYGVSVNQETLERLVTTDWNVAVVPCVKDEVDWDQFRKKTLANEEDVHQRALKFDIEMKPIAKKTDVMEFVSGTPRVFSVDSKAVLKKLRDASTDFKSFDQLKKLGIKICVLRSAPVICHYVYECIGNILDSSGVRATR
jgi:hypothetical protein